MTEWRVFAAFVVEYLGMPVEAMPLYAEDSKWSRKAARVCRFVLEVGDFGHKQRRDFRGMGYWWRKFVSVGRRLGDYIHIFYLFSNIP